MSEAGCAPDFLFYYSRIAQIVIAGVNLFLAGYLLFYRIKKDRKDEKETARLNEQNIKLQWFKELVVQPNKHKIDGFYEALGAIEGLISSNELGLEERQNLNNIVKREQSKLRKSFVDLVLHIDRKFADELLENLDDLTDTITNAIFNDELKLAMPAVYEKHIGKKIAYSKNKFIAQLYNYRGISS